MIALLATLFVVGAADARDQLPLYDGAGSAFTVGKKHGSAGLFAPVRYGVAERVELSTSGLATFVAPRLDVKVTALQSDTFGLGLVAGVGVPTFGFRLLEGTVLSSDPDQRVPWAAIAKGAVALSARTDDFTVTLWAQGRIAVPGSDQLRPSDAPWVDVALQPLTEGPQLTTKVVVDWFPTDAAGLQSWGTTVEGRVHFGGLGPDVDARVFGRYRASRNLALGAGAAWSWARTEAGRPMFLVPLVDVFLRW